jgi:hypothetical protein
MTMENRLTVDIELATVVGSPQLDSFADSSPLHNNKKDNNEPGGTPLDPQLTQQSLRDRSRGTIETSVGSLRRNSDEGSEKVMTTYDYVLQQKITSYFLILTLLRRPQLNGTCCSWIFLISYWLWCCCLVAGLIVGWQSTVVSAEFLYKMPVHSVFFKTVAVISYISLASITFAAAYSWIHTYFRLLHPLQAVDIPYIVPAIREGLIFGGVFTLMSFVGELISYPNNPAQAFGIYYFQYFYCSGIALSMFCIYIDAHTSAAVVQDLLSMAKMESLTVSKLQAARAQIDGIVDKSLMPNAVLAFAGLVNGVEFILAVLLVRILSGDYFNDPLLAQVHSEYAQKGFIVGQMLNYIAALLKEAIFLVFALFHIARVNDMADELYAQLSDCVWKDAQKDDERIKCYVNFTGKPISFTLLTIRPTKTLVYSYVGSYIISVIIAVVQQAVNPILQSSSES